MDQECGDSEYQHGYIHTFRNWAATDKPSSQNDKKRSQRIALGLPVTLNSERKSAVVPTDTLARYVGRCQLTPTISNTITLQEGHLFSQVEN